MEIRKNSSRHHSRRFIRMATFIGKNISTIVELITAVFGIVAFVWRTFFSLSLEMLGQYAEIGRELWVLDVTSDLGVPVTVALSRSTSGPHEHIMLGFGAHLDPRLAVRRAVSARLPSSAARITCASKPSTPPATSTATCPSPRCSRSTVAACQSAANDSSGQGKAALAAPSGRPGAASTSRCTSRARP